MTGILELLSVKKQSLKYVLFGTDKKYKQSQNELLRRVKEENNAIAELRTTISELLEEKTLENDRTQ